LGIALAKFLTPFRIMNLFPKTRLAALVIAASSAATAFAADVDPLRAVDAIRAFARCDYSFFVALASEPSPFGSAIELQHLGAIATPTVRNPRVEADRVQRFIEPVDVEGLRLYAWRNEISFNPGSGSSYWWGFDIAGHPNQIVPAINRLLPPDLQVIFNGGEWWRGEARGANDPLNQWPLPATSYGVAPRPGTVERVLVVGAGKQPGSTRFYCTLQGAVTPELLSRIRPDLPPPMR
jgi:hypothetical protein